MIRKVVFLFLLFAFAFCHGFGQDLKTKRKVDSLKHELARVKNDTSHVLIMAGLCSVFQLSDYDSLRVYADPALALAQRIKFARGEARVLAYMGFGMGLQGNVPRSLEFLFKALQISQQNHYAYETALCLADIGNSYLMIGDFAKTNTFSKQSVQIIANLPKNPETTWLKTLGAINIGNAYTEMDRPDSALFFLQIANNTAANDEYWHKVVLMFLGELQLKTGNRQKAFDYLWESIRLSNAYHDNLTKTDACRYIAILFKETGQPDSCIYYAKEALVASQACNYKPAIIENSKLLANEYEIKDIRLSHYYLKMAMAANEEVYGVKKVNELQKTLSDEQQRRREAEAETVAHQARLKQYIFFDCLVILVLIGFILYRNNKLNGKARD